MDIVKAILKFLSLSDYDGNVSISNLAVVACLVKILITPEISMVEVGALLGALSNYSLKRFENRKAVELEANLGPEPEEVDNLKADLDMMKSSYDSLTREAQEMKKIISEHNLQKAFKK